MGQTSQYLMEALSLTSDFATSLSFLLSVITMNLAGLSTTNIPDLKNEPSVTCSYSVLLCLV